MKVPRIPKKWRPSNKWAVARVTAGSTVVAMFWAGDGINTVEEKILVIGMVAEALNSYITRNEPKEPPNAQ